MQRIVIIGCGGAGKSTFARQLGTLLEIEVVHLDALYWNRGWVETPRDKWAAVQHDLVQGERWIADGDYGSTLDIRLAAADTVVFLDLPRRVCLWRAIWRAMRYWGRPRPDMAAGCPERLDWIFLKSIWDYRQTRRPGILRRLEQLAGSDKGKTIVRLRSPQDVKRFLARLKRAQRIVAET